MTTSEEFGNPPEVEKAVREKSTKSNKKQYFPTNNYLETVARYFERLGEGIYEGPDGSGTEEWDQCNAIAEQIRKLKNGPGQIHPKEIFGVPSGPYLSDDGTDLSLKVHRIELLKKVGHDPEQFVKAVRTLVLLDGTDVVALKMGLGAERGYILLENLTSAEISFQLLYQMLKEGLGLDMAEVMCL